MAAIQANASCRKYVYLFGGGKADGNKLMINTLGGKASCLLGRPILCVSWDRSAMLILTPHIEPL